MAFYIPHHHSAINEKGVTSERFLKPHKGLDSYHHRSFSPAVFLPPQSNSNITAMRAIVLLLAFVSSAFAYSVTVPNSSQGWTNQGPQTYVFSIKNINLPPFPR